MNPKVTEYIPGKWDGSCIHIDFLKERISKTDPLGLGYWSIFLKDNPDDFLGWIHLLPLQNDKQAAEIDWRLKHSVWGNGYATEAARMIVAYTFKTAVFDRLFSYTLPVKAHHVQSSIYRRSISQGFSKEFLSKVYCT
nr:GNAT family N-acetyltransferase [Bacteroides intestinalis]